jgi:hypothetical protein
MKKIITLSLFLFCPTIISNVQAGINKDVVKTFSFLHNIIDLGYLIIPQEYKDQCTITYDNNRYNLWPDTVFNLPLPTFLLMDNQNIIVPLDFSSIIKKISFSSIEETLDFPSAIIEGIKKIKNVDEKQKEAMTFGIETISKKIINHMLNNAIIEDGIIKRLLKIICFSITKTGSAYLRNYFFDQARLDHFPSIQSIAINSTIEESIIQLVALLLSFIIENPKTKKQKILNQKIQAILENYPISQSNQAIDYQTKI